MFLKFCSRKGYAKDVKVFSHASFLTTGYDALGDPCYLVYGMEGTDDRLQELPLFHWRLTSCNVLGKESLCED